MKYNGLTNTYNSYFTFTIEKVNMSHGGIITTANRKSHKITIFYYQDGLTNKISKVLNVNETDHVYTESFNNVNFTIPSFF